MKKTVLINVLLAVGLTFASGMAFAGKQEVKTESPVVVDDMEVAVNALNTMSEYLRSLDSFTVHGSANYDEVLENGQKVQLSRAVIVKADPPSSLWAKTSSMYSNQEFFFDGKTFTLSTPAPGYYASVEAPSTIGELIIKLRDKFNVEMPLSDLFLWGSQLDAEDAVDEAIIVGVDQINGVSCTQFAFREKLVDWQIWIQRGDMPLPLKLVITSKDDKTLPQYQIVLQWDTAPILAGQSFTFTPAVNDIKINFQTVAEIKKEKKP